MERNKTLVIISNEKTSKNKNEFYCDNIDMKSIPEGLSENFNVLILARKSNIKRSFQIKIEKIKIASNIFGFLTNVFKAFKNKETKYLLVSITPYSFFAYLLLFIFRKKIFVYLRSNGYEEYKAIFGFIGPLIYHFMYVFVTFKSHIIICQKRLVRKKISNLVSPSQLDNNWFVNKKKPSLDKPRLLYVGRIKVEKGVFSFFKILEKINDSVELSIVGNTENTKPINKKINFLGYGYNTSELVAIYDNHNIFILPSFTEAHPQVVDESLARGRPVIIFEEIAHIIQNRKGIFISKRNAKSLSETIEFVMKNYLSIQESMSNNKLPTRQKFISQMTNILRSN